MIYLLVLGLALRIVFYFLFFQAEAWNIHMAQGFDERALLLIQGQAVPFLTAWGSYPLWLAPFYKLLEILGLLEQRGELIFWYHQFLSLASSVLLFCFLKRCLHVGRAGAFMAVGGLMILNPALIYLSGMKLSETLFQSVLILGLVLYRPWFPLKPVWRGLGVGMLLAVALSLRNILLPFVILVPLYGALKNRKSLRSAAGMAFATGAGSFILSFLLISQLNGLFDAEKIADTSMNRGANIAQTWCQAKALEYETADKKFWFSPPAFWSLAETRSLFLNRDFRDVGFYVTLGWRCLEQDPARLLLQSHSFWAVFLGPFYPDPLQSSLAGLTKFYGWVYLTLFFLVLLYAPYLWRHDIGRLLCVFIFCQLLAVYVGNVGEARLVYSFLPALTVLGGLLLQKFSRSPQQAILMGTVAVATSVLLLGVPTRGALISAREKSHFLAKDSSEQRAVVAERLQKAPSVSRPRLCQEVLPALQPCLQTKDCSENTLRPAWEELKQLNRQVMTEHQLFCRNLLLVRLHRERHIQIPAPLIQKPASFLVEENPLVLSLEAVAGAFLHLVLLRDHGRMDLAPPGSSVESALYQVLSFQHRYDFNRADYQGQVTFSLREGRPNEEAAAVFRETLIHGFLRRKAEAKIRPPHPE